MTDIQTIRPADAPPREGDRPTQADPPVEPPPPTFPNGPRGPRFLPCWTDDQAWTGELVAEIAFYGMRLPATEPVKAVPA